MHMTVIILTIIILTIIIRMAHGIDTVIITSGK